MKQLFLKREGNPNLLLFFAGWGADEHLFDRPVPPGYDYLLCFDYRTPHFDTTLLGNYQSIRLLAWSMGVWAATRALSGLQLPYQMKLAVNGTSCPIDDCQGIPEAIFQGTLEHFSDSVLARFRRRICGSAETVKEFLSHTPARSTESLHEELEVLWHDVKAQGAFRFGWDKAIVGSKDKIFPATNQRAAWLGIPIEERDVEHYDPTLFDRLLNGEEAAWIRN